MKRWLVTGGVLTVAAVAAGTGTAVSALASYSRTETQTHTYSGDATRISVDAEQSGGDITLMRGSAGQIRVERRLHWSSKKPRIDERWDGSTFSTSGHCGSHSGMFGASCDVAYTIWVPDGAAVTARSSAGDLRAMGLRGDLSLTTSAGELRVAGVQGRLWLRTDAGDVSAENLTSPQANVYSSAGDVHLSFAAAPSLVDTETEAGDVSIEVPNGAYAVRSTTNQSSHVNVTEDSGSARSIVARSQSGDVTIDGV